MNNLFKTTVIAMLTFVLRLFGWFIYLISFGQINIVSSKTKRAKLSIPVTYTLGWWTNQKALEVVDLQIDIVESKLTLFSNTSLVSYKISGQLTNETHWQALVSEVHISERINTDMSLDYDRIIEITPVVKGKENKNINSGIHSFSLSNQHCVASTKWGVNRIKFVCGSKEQIIELQQNK